MAISCFLRVSNSIYNSINLSTRFVPFCIIQPPKVEFSLQGD